MSDTRDMPRIEVRPTEPSTAPTEWMRDPVAPTKPRRSRKRRALKILVFTAVAFVVCATVVPRLTMWTLARGDVAHGADDVPAIPSGEHRAAIVLGAGLKNDKPSPLLDDRIKAAVELLDNGRVDLLVMTGDNSTSTYDEPTAMRTRAIELGADPDSVAADYAGRRTWDSCMRAHDVFGIRDAVVVTNAFHVDRAVVTCKAAGIDTRGYSVDDSRFSTKHRAVWRTRELAASGRALLDAWILRPAPAVGGAEIDPYDPCELRASLAPSDAISNGQGAGDTC